MRASVMHLSAQDDWTEPAVPVMIPDQDADLLKLLQQPKLRHLKALRFPPLWWASVVLGWCLN